MMERREKHTPRTIRGSRFSLVILFGCLALLAIPQYAWADGTILGWGLVFLFLGLLQVAKIAFLLAWLTPLVGFCKRLYREVFPDRSNLHDPSLFRSTFWELLICLVLVLWVPAGFLILSYGATLYWTVLARETA